jgi:hypothetical protein
MKNLTLSVDETDLRAVRRYAAEKNTTVNRLVRQYLHQIATNEDRARQARENILKLAEKSSAKIGDATWTRDDLHAR